VREEALDAENDPFGPKNHCYARGYSYKYFSSIAFVYGLKHRQAVGARPAFQGRPNISMTFYKALKKMS